MVKRLDENEMPDHIGIRLWRANEFWTKAFIAAMNVSGHDWFTPARAHLLAHVPREGARQAEIVRRTGLTKQAAQQLIDGLALDGILERLPDPDDKRGNRIVYSARGRAALSEADRIKRDIEDSLRERLGARAFAQLFDALGEVPAK